MNQAFTIAAVQFRIAHLKPEVNIARAEKFIAQAKSQQAQVIVFPEDFLTGSIGGDPNYLIADDRYQKIFQALAQKYQIDIVTGSWMQKTPAGTFNRSTYIDASGTVLGVYDKNHLYHSEQSFLTPGHDIAVFSTTYGKAGIIICWDILFPEIFARMKKQSVQIVFCPSYWYKEIAGAGLQYNANSEEQHIDALCITRAVENNIVFIYTNAADIITHHENDTPIGHSQITLPIASVVKLNHNAEKMLVRNIDLDLLKLATKEYRLD